MIIVDRCISIQILSTLLQGVLTFYFEYKYIIILRWWVLLLHQRGLCTDCITSCVIIKLTFSKMHIKTENFKLNASGKQFSSFNVLVWRRRVKSTYVQFVLTIIVCSCSSIVTRKTLTGVLVVNFFFFMWSQLITD